MQLRRLVFALVAGGWLLSSATADAQQPREKGQNLAPAADAARVMTDVKYGVHQRNVMDVWLARSDKPTPVLVSIHGGGFRAGNKSVEPALRDQCLAAGISVVAITYRLSQDLSKRRASAGLPVPLCGRVRWASVPTAVCTPLRSCACRRICPS